MVIQGLSSDKFPGLKLKAWAYMTVSVGAATLISGGNVSSVARVGVGFYQVNFTSPMNTAAYIVDAKNAQAYGTANALSADPTTKLVGSVTVCALANGAATDGPGGFYVGVYE
jgi:hypothetical protein